MNADRHFFQRYEVSWVGVGVGDASLLVMCSGYMGVSILFLTSVEAPMYKACRIACDALRAYVLGRAHADVGRGEYRGRPASGPQAEKQGVERVSGHAQQRRRAGKERPRSPKGCPRCLG